MADFALEFWNRVDDIKGRMTLKELSERAGISYATMKDMRTRCRFPKKFMIQQIAEVLGVSEVFLVKGKEYQPQGVMCVSPEALAVENDDRLKALVRACLRDPRLLEVVSAVIESSERTLGKQA